MVATELSSDSEEFFKYLIAMFLQLCQFHSSSQLACLFWITFKCDIFILKNNNNGINGINGIFTYSFFHLSATPMQNKQTIVLVMDSTSSTNTLVSVDEKIVLFALFVITSVREIPIHMISVEMCSHHIWLMWRHLEVVQDRGFMMIAQRCVYDHRPRLIKEYFFCTKNNFNFICKTEFRTFSTHWR